MSRRRRLGCILLWGSNSSLWAGPQASRPRPILLAPPTQSHLPWDGAAWGLDLPSLLLPVPPDPTPVSTHTTPPHAPSLPTWWGPSCSLSSPLPHLPSPTQWLFYFPWL